MKRGRLSLDGPVVAPRAGAWIEIFCLFEVNKFSKVAPRAGAWIEMVICSSLRS